MTDITTVWDIANSKGDWVLAAPRSLQVMIWLPAC